MKAVMIMFDSLNRRHLSPYGCDWIDLPNFDRLAKHSVQFENHYVGSMPCIPARRELHTGRYNFLHRSWGPIEPFDDSIFELMEQNGIYSHLVTDHQHYWEDGGGTYHTRYSSYELIRGQEGDPWKAQIGTSRDESEFNSIIDEFPLMKKMKIHDAINRKYLDTEAKMPQTQTFDCGIDFLNNHAQKDNWFLQIESFDPHEPFHAAKEFKEKFNLSEEGPTCDWPPYDIVKEDQTIVERTKLNYAALLTQCDKNLGRVLDLFDKHNLWEDTMLIVNTDHGYLLGEHGWWSKSIMPMYNEIAHVPLFIYSPVHKVCNQKRQALTQSIDIPATLLNHFSIKQPKYMQGHPLDSVIEDDASIRSHALFGNHGQHVNITDGEKLYMRSPATIDNGPLYEYTLMPTHMRSRFSVAELKDATLETNQFSFMKGVPCLKIPVKNPSDNFFNFGSKLFDLEKDPEQKEPLEDLQEELRMIKSLLLEMKKNEAPEEQYERLGLPKENDLSIEWLIESKRQLKQYKKPLILTDFNWSETAKNIYRFYEKLVQPTPELKGMISDKLSEALPVNEVDPDILMALLLQFVPPEQKLMVEYFLKIAARNQ